MFIGNQDKNKVERAISEIRRSLPILIYNESGYLLFAAAETVKRNLFNQYKLISNNQAFSQEVSFYFSLFFYKNFSSFYPLFDC